MTTAAAAFERLATAYGDRDSALAEARRSSRVLVGCVGNTVPLELITACGARAFRLAPVAGDPRASDRLVEHFADRDARLLFANFLAGAYDHLDLLVLPRSSETSHKLYLALREAVRTGAKQGGPALWLFDVLHTQRDSSRRYGLARMHELAAQVAALTGQRPTEAGLRAAVEAANERRTLLQRLQGWRHEGRIRGWQAQVATGGSLLLAPADAVSTLAAWLAEVPAVSRKGLRLFVQGVPLDHSDLHAAVDAAGGCIVQEDDDWGARAATPLIGADGDPFEAVFDHYWSHVPCLRIHPAPTGTPAFVSAWQAGRVDGLLFNLPRPDDLHGWLLPAQRAAAVAAGLPCCVLRNDARDAATLPPLRRQLSDFISGLIGQNGHNGLNAPTAP